VVEVALRRASIDGLEGLTIGRLAEDVGMSKAGIHGLFGSKEDLQVTTFRQAVAEFTHEVWDPVKNREPGLPRLLALLDSWLSYHRRRVLPGGCLVTTATIEFDARPGPLQDLVASARRRMHALLEADIRKAVEAGDLPPETKPADIAFTLYALASAASQAIQLQEPGAATRARRAMRAALGVS
jgi:AcrR family transcriptional regulator